MSHDWLAGFGAGFACGPFVILGWLRLLRYVAKRHDA